MSMQCQTAVGFIVHTKVQNRSVNNRFIIIARGGMREDEADSAYLRGDVDPRMDLSRSCDA
jgi:hypothetical protein